MLQSLDKFNHLAKTFDEQWPAIKCEILGPGKKKEGEDQYYFVLVVSSQRGEAGTQEENEKAGEHLQRQREVKKTLIKNYDQ